MTWGLIHTRAATRCGHRKTIVHNPVEKLTALFATIQMCSAITVPIKINPAMQSAT